MTPGVACGGGSRRVRPGNPGVAGPGRRPGGRQGAKLETAGRRRENPAHRFTFTPISHPLYRRPQMVRLAIELVAVHDARRITGETMTEIPTALTYRPGQSLAVTDRQLAHNP